MITRFLLPALILFAAAFPGRAADALRAFPEAEGFGANTPGGRGGDVYHVTSLNDSGAGSLRNGISTAQGPRTIVFDISGNIVLKSELRVNKPFLTLAGQTAPGDGVTVTGWTTSVTGTHDIIIRYMRFRPGDINCPAMQGDSLTVDKSTDVIIDHVSASWSIDETLSVTNSDRVTVQWSLISESLDQSCHLEGEHGYGSLLRYGSGNLTFHHNLYAHHHNRTPRLGDNLTLDFVGNVIYDYGFNNGDGGYSGTADEGTPHMNYVGNYVIAGPTTPASRRSRAFAGGSANTFIYQSGNLIDGNLNHTLDGTDTGWGMFVGSYTRQDTPFAAPGTATIDNSAITAITYQGVLAGAGASLVRDAVDLRVIADVRNETGKVINSQNDVGGWPELKSLPAPVDTDRDGMPDVWEIAFGLNPRDPSDGPAVSPLGYTNLELYLGDRAAGAPLPAAVSSVIVDDTFADGNSQNQDLANNSLQVFNGRTNNIRTDQVGSMTLDVTPAGTSSEAIWAYFTKAGSPVALGVGDKLAVIVTFSLNGFTANAQDIRWGVFDSQGTRNTTNLSGGQNDATFVGDTGYGLDFFASGSGSPFVIARRTVLSSANVFNSFGDFTPIPGTGANTRQSLADNTPYTLTYTIARVTETDTRIVAAVSGGALSLLNYSAVESSPTPNTTFDYFAFRFGGTNFTKTITFTELLVQYTPAPPVITSQPQPYNLVLQVGGKINLAVGASGNDLHYQWQKDGHPVSGNASASTPTLNLNNVQLSDAGSYTVVVSNAGGSVTSNPVVLEVVTFPVAPAPVILIQPSDRTVTIGHPTSLQVTVLGGNDFIYAWVKDNGVVPDSSGAVLSIHSARLGDSGSYYVFVSNSSGGVQSATAHLTVVSDMTPLGFRPWNQQTGVCTDTALYIAFDRAPKVGKSGRVRVYNSAGALVDTIDMSASPQNKVIGGTPYVYYPVIVTGNIAAIYLHQPLPYGDTYSVTMDPGVLTDSDGVPFAGFSDPNFWTFGAKPPVPGPLSNSLTVAYDGGDFCTVQSAIDAVPANNTQPFTITVRPGTYTEINYVPSNKPFITIRGEDRDGTIIQYPNNATLNNGNSRAQFGVDAPDFTLQDITIWNITPKGGSQAEAFRGNNQRILLNRVNLKSFQDTLLLTGTGFVTDSYIEGDVDFMWGNGAVFFQNTEMKAVSSGGYYTQIRNGQGQKGNVYVNCKLTSPAGVTGVYLGRIDPTVFPYSQVVYINSTMGPHIIPAGWLLNNSNTAPNVQFWEYKSTDLNGAPLDVSQRLNVSRQLSAAEATQWSDPAFVLGGWVPPTVSASAASGSIDVNWSAAASHSAKDWIGLYQIGAADQDYLSMQYLGAATTGRLTFAMPARPGPYELRLFLNDGYTRVAASNRVSQ
jgi:pectin methylesterase-like acyl-CoA thioesterase